MESGSDEKLIASRQSQAIMAEFVSMEYGTGIEHIAPGYGPKDYQAGL
jgi:isoleucyl-tRNA synthetase